MKILYMGTPDFAASILEKICETDNEIVGVLTQPDKPRGRGYELSQSPVKKLALEKGIAVYQPETLKDEAFLPELEKLAPELIIVAAYGKILPKYVLDFPSHGCINVHGSLLPKYRGAAPIQRSIIDGEKKTGITIMKMAEGLDTGDMMIKGEVDILENDNFEDIHDKLALCAGDLIVEAIKLISEGKDTYEVQDDTLATYAEKITKDDCLIDFNMSSEQVHNRIRGLSPIPLAYGMLDSKIIKFLSSQIIDKDTVYDDDEVGTIISTDSSVITVACKYGSVGITGVLPEGKKRMSSAEFIRGKQDLTGQKFSK